MAIKATTKPITNAAVTTIKAAVSGRRRPSLFQRARRGRQHDADDEGRHDRDERLPGQVEGGGDGDDGEDRDRPGRNQPKPIDLIGVFFLINRLELAAVAPRAWSPPGRVSAGCQIRALNGPKLASGEIVPGEIVVAG